MQHASVNILTSDKAHDTYYVTGLFTALQPRIIACTKTAAGVSMVVKFLVGPAVMAVTSLMVGIRGQLLQVSIVQVSVKWTMWHKFHLFFGLNDENN